MNYIIDIAVDYNDTNPIASILLLKKTECHMKENHTGRKMQASLDGLSKDWTWATSKKLIPEEPNVGEISIALALACLKYGYARVGLLTLDP